MYDEYNKPDPSLVVMRDIRERVAICFAVVVSLLALGITSIVLELQRKKSSTKQARKAAVIYGTAEETEAKEEVLQLARAFMEDEDWGAASACYSKVLALELPEESRFSCLFNRGVANSRQGDLELAKRDFEDAARLDPDVVECYLNLAWVAEQASDLAAATSNLQNVIKFAPSNPIGYGNMARLAFIQGEHRICVELLSHAIRLAPSNPILRINRAIVLGKLKRYRGAIWDLEHDSVKEHRNELTIKLSALMYLRAGQGERALQTLAQHQTQWEDGPGLALIALSSLKDLTQRKTAKNELNAAKAEAELSALLHEEIGKGANQLRTSFEDMLLLEDAFQPFELCAPMLVGSQSDLRLNRDTQVSAFEQGIEFIEGGDIYSGIACFSESVRSRIQPRKALQERALAFLNLGEHEKALSDLEEVVSQTPDDAEIWTLMGIVSSRQNNFVTARKCLDQAVRLAPDNWVVYVNRAKINFLDGDYEAVLRDCERANMKGADSAEVIDLKARAHAGNDELEKAVESHKTAVSLSGDKVGYVLSFADTLEKNGRHSDALELLKPIAKSSADLKVWKVTGQCFFATGQYVNAVKAAQEVLNIDSEDEEAWLLLARSLFESEAFSDSLKAYANVEQLATEKDQKNRFVALTLSDEHEEAMRILETLELGDSEEHLKLAVQAARESGNLLRENEFISKLLGKTHPASRETLLFRSATICQSLGKWSESFKILNEILAIEPTNPEAWFLIGKYYDKQEKAGDAIKAFSRALAIEDRHHQARLARARVLIANEDFGKALIDLQVLATINQDNEEAQELISMCMKRYQLK